MAGTLFFVTALSEGPKVRERLKRLIGEDDFYELADDRWFVVYNGLGRELAEKVGVRGGADRLGNGLVLPVTTYSGHAPSALWEWLSKKDT